LLKTIHGDCFSPGVSVLCLFWYLVCFCISSAAFDIELLAYVYWSMLFASIRVFLLINVLIAAMWIPAGNRGLSGSSACRWYIDEDVPDINSFRARFVLWDEYVHVIPWFSSLLALCLSFLSSYYSIGDDFTPLAEYAPSGLPACVHQDPSDAIVLQLTKLDPFDDMVWSLFSVVSSSVCLFIDFSWF
jgi:hypothetical protein